jgi:trans-aconitate 2-methyltransferase
MSHATEAAEDAATYACELADFIDARTSIRMLDFGCGTGEFTERFLTTLKWPAKALELTLVEPVNRQRENAALQLSRFSGRPISVAEGVTRSHVNRFDVVLANHVLYYVDDLDSTLRQLVDSLSLDGKLLTAIAGADNPLIQLWTIGFTMLGRPVPYYTSEDVESSLMRMGSRFRKTKSHYQLQFPDSSENRLKILRFLFGEHLDEIGPLRLLGEFDRFNKSAYVEVNTNSDHFSVESRRS